MLERAQRDGKVQRIVEDARLLDGLTEHAGWRRLRDKIRADSEGFLSGLARRLMRGDRAADLQQEIDFHRGFYAGARFVIDAPEEAMKNLEKAARAAYAHAQLLEEHAEQEDRPYA